MPGFNSKMNQPYSNENSSVNWGKVGLYSGAGLMGYGMARAGYMKGKGPFASIMGIQKGSWEGAHRAGGSKVLSSMKPHSKKAVKQATAQVRSSMSQEALDGYDAAKNAHSANKSKVKKSQKAHSSRVKNARKDLNDWVEANKGAKPKQIKDMQSHYAKAHDIETTAADLKAAQRDAKASRSTFKPHKKTFQEALEKALPERTGFDKAMKKTGWRGDMAKHGASAVGWLTAADKIGVEKGLGRIGTGLVRGGVALAGLGVAKKLASWANPFSD